MKLIVGLGNPGKKFKNTRHNIGFMAIDALAREWDIGWQTNGKRESLKAQKITEGTEILLLKPQTFMNLSGEAVVKIVNFYKIKPEDIIVIHDDIDLPLGQLKIQKGGGTAGHHGLESIVESLRASEFVRFRVGIGRPEEKLEARREVIDHVLEKFTSKEWVIMEKMIERTAEAIWCYLDFGLDRAMNKYNYRKK